MAVKNIIGKPVAGANFFGREHELNDLKRITEEEHVLLLAPRRVGKTSLLLALQAETNKTDGTSGSYVSVAAARDERHFVELVLDSIYATGAGAKLRPNRMGSWLQRKGRQIRGVKVGAAGATAGIDLHSGGDGWQEDANRAIVSILRSDLQWLILIDELPTLVLTIAQLDPSGQRVRAFLQWFRDLRQLPAALGKLRFVLAGSVGLDSVTRRHLLTHTINDLRDWRLGPYDTTVADHFLKELAGAYQVDLGAELRREICDHAEWLIPYHLQVIFSALRECSGGRTPSKTHLKQAIEALLARKTYFNSWVERLREALGTPEDKFARLVLATCASDPRGATRSSLSQSLMVQIPDLAKRNTTLTWLLDVLLNDGYLVEHQGRWRFRSGLLRRYWERHVR